MYVNYNVPYYNLPITKLLLLLFILHVIYRYDAGVSFRSYHGGKQPAICSPSVYLKIFQLN